MESCKFYVYKVMSPVNSSIMNSIPLCTSFVWLSWLRIPEVCWLKVVEVNISLFFLFQEQAFSFSPWNIQPIRLWISFVLLECVSAILNLLTTLRASWDIELYFFFECFKSEHMDFMFVTLTESILFIELYVGQSLPSCYES